MCGIKAKLGSTEEGSPSSLYSLRVAGTTAPKETFRFGSSPPSRRPSRSRPVAEAVFWEHRAARCATFVDEYEPHNLQKTHLPVRMTIWPNPWGAGHGDLYSSSLQWLEAQHAMHLKRCTEGSQANSCGTPVGGITTTAGGLRQGGRTTRAGRGISLRRGKTRDMTNPMYLPTCSTTMRDLLSRSIAAASTG